MPAKKCDEVHHCLRRVSFVAIILNGDVALALGKFGAILVEEKGKMRKRRFFPSERAIHEDVFWCRGKPFFATDHVRNFHVMIIDDVGEVIRGKAIGFHEDLVVD